MPPWASDCILFVAFVLVVGIVSFTSPYGSS